MASKVPIIKQTAWIALIPQTIVLLLLIFLYYLTGTPDFFLYGVITNLLITFALRYFIPKYHRQGMALVKQKYFDKAIPCFEKSVAFFSKYAWVDKYRFVTLLSSSKMCYREMALNNIAFCYGQIGDGEKAMAYYERTLAAYPGNELANAGLNLLKAGMKRE